jgi:hypothetical protein
MEAIETIQKDNGYKIEIHMDSDPVNPRKDWEPLGKMICFHRRYTLGDNHDLRSDMFAGWDEMESYIRKELDAAVILPLYLYDHSGITMSICPFGDRWDSGQVGFIYMTKEDAKKNWKKKIVTKKLREKITECLQNEVEIYDMYLRGEVYGFNVIDPEGEIVETSWGYFGDDHKESGLLENADLAYANDAAYRKSREVAV